MKHAHPLTLTFPHIHRIHAVGAGGTTIAGLIEILHAWGRRITASDAVSNTHTARLASLGIPLSITRKIPHIPHDADLVLVSPRVPRNHPDLVLAKQWGIPIVATAEMLGLISVQHRTLAVAGAHGKTTVTAYLGTLLAATGIDPTVLARSTIDAWQSNVRSGKGDIFITEADENQRRFLHLHPSIALIMNIEADHMDYFKDMKAVIKAFHEFTHQLPHDATCIVNYDDPHVREVVKRIKAKVITFGRGEGADVRAIGIKTGATGTSFSAHLKRGEEDLSLTLDLAGEYQIMNALAVIAAAHTLSLPLDSAKHVLESYAGGKRHMERMGERDGITVIDDAADHPSEIAAVLKGIRERYPEQKIWCVFQPYLAHRTGYLLNEFAQSFTNADRLFILPILKGVEEGGGEESARPLVEATQKYHPFVQLISPPYEAKSRTEDAVSGARGGGGLASPNASQGGEVSAIFNDIPPHAILVTLGADPVRAIGEQIIH